MKLFCWYCHKPVSTELPEGSIFRAIAICPECIEKDNDEAVYVGEKELKQIREEALDIDFGKIDEIPL